mmetsp:Transcript_69443/g.136600  ORF Transcript_69443/g.136600 Transcript_69443/m.136600 type:complete len:518 (+) Transcript_69443:124-1677(+)
MSLKHLIPTLADDSPSLTLPTVHSSIETKAPLAAPLLSVTPDANNVTTQEIIHAKVVPKTKRNRALLACLGCNKAKVRCEALSAGISCVRCEKLKVQCVFPELSSSSVDVISRNKDTMDQCMHSEEFDDQEVIPSKKRLAISAKVEESVDFSPFRCYIDESLLKHMNAECSVANIPIELLRETAVIGVRHQDLALIGSTLSMAAAVGFSLRDLLGSESTSRAIAGDLMSMFQGAAQGAATAKDITSLDQNPYVPPCIVVSKETDILSAALSACTSWAHDDLTSMGLGPAKMTCKKISSTGEKTIWFNQLFQDEFCSCEGMLEIIVSKSVPDFVHPEDLGILYCRHELWKTLSPPVQVEEDGTMQRMSFYESKRPIRFKKTPTIPSFDGEADAFTACHHSSQLVIRNNHDGQESYMLCTYRDILELEPSREGAGVADNSSNEDVLATTAATFARAGSVEEGQLLYTAGTIGGDKAADEDKPSAPVETSFNLYDNGSSDDTEDVTEFWAIIAKIGEEEV